MTLSISNEPSPWHRTTTHLPKPKRASLLSDATIDPFPQRVTRSASLLEHHIVRGPYEPTQPEENGRRRSLAYLPEHRLPPPGLVLPSIEDPYDPSGRKRKASDMSEKEDGSSSPNSTGQPPEAQGYCLCQPEPKIPRPRNGKSSHGYHKDIANKVNSLHSLSSAPASQCSPTESRPSESGHLQDHRRTMEPTPRRAKE